jgi:hypothetical protein
MTATAPGLAKPAELIVCRTGDVLCFADAHPGAAGWIAAVGTLLVLIATVVMMHRTIVETKRQAWRAENRNLQDTLHFIDHVERYLGQVNSMLEMKLPHMAFRTYLVDKNHGMITTTRNLIEHANSITTRDATKWSTLSIYSSVVNYVAEVGEFIEYLETNEKASEPKSVSPELDNIVSKLSESSRQILNNTRMIRKSVRREMRRLS